MRKARTADCGVRTWVAGGLGLLAPAAQASIFKGEALDKAADVLTIIVLVVVPIVAIAVFWLVHILPEKVAEQREHPQKDAIKVLCLLSLVFGGLLWPIAWIMAYSKPVLYKMAYGRDKHDDYYRHLAAADADADAADADADADAKILGDDVARLKAELDTLAARGKLPVELQEMRARLVELEGRLPPAAPPTAAPPPAAPRPAGEPG